jgi:diguanylate cyclase (GGDEF)-like protein
MIKNVRKQRRNVPMFLIDISVPRNIDPAINKLDDVYLYDIDDFKRYNDRFGHAAGDEILRETAAMMKQITRRHDVVARIGGDEFAVLFWDTGPTRQPNSQPLQTAYQLADRFRRAVSSHAFQALGPKASGTLTISGGLATFPWDGWTIDQLLRRADEALLSAKANGKNNIHLVGGE